MMEHDKLGLISVQEYYEKEYNCHIQLPCMPLIVVASKKGVSTKFNPNITASRF